MENRMIGKINKKENKLNAQFMQQSADEIESNKHWFQRMEGNVKQKQTEFLTIGT